MRHDLEGFLAAYINALGIHQAEKTAPLFRSAIRRTGQLTERLMSAANMSRMVKRRMRDVQLSSRLSPDSFRVTTITDCSSKGFRWKMSSTWRVMPILARRGSTIEDKGE